MTKYIITDDSADRCSWELCTEWAAANGLNARLVGFPVEVDTDARTITAPTYSTENDSTPVDTVSQLVVDPPLALIAYSECRHGCVIPVAPDGD